MSKKNNQKLQNIIKSYNEKCKKRELETANIDWLNWRLSHPQLNNILGKIK